MNIISKLIVFFIAGAGSQVSIVSSDYTAPAMLQPVERVLGYGDIVSINRMGQKLRVISGSAWITFDGEDMFVLAGEEIVLEPGMYPAVISALKGQPLVYQINE